MTEPPLYIYHQESLYTYKDLFIDSIMWTSVLLFLNPKTLNIKSYLVALKIYIQWRSEIINKRLKHIPEGNTFFY